MKNPGRWFGIFCLKVWFVMGQAIFNRFIFKLLKIARPKISQNFYSVWVNN